jgi:hypothetical protein
MNMTITIKQALDRLVQNQVAKDALIEKNWQEVKILAEEISVLNPLIGCYVKRECHMRPYMPELNEHDVLRFNILIRAKIDQTIFSKTYFLDEVGLVDKILEDITLTIGF